MRWQISKEGIGRKGIRQAAVHHSLIFSFSHTHTSTMVHPPRCHPSLGFRWEANISRLRSWGLLTPHLLWETAIWSLGEKCSLYFYLFIKIMKCALAFCASRLFNWLFKPKTNYDKSIQHHQQTWTSWLLDNKPLNCTPNWQAGKPIHSRADTET